MMKNKECLDCKHCYVEDLYYELCCDIDKSYIGDLHTKERAKNCKYYEQEEREK